MKQKLLNALLILTSLFGFLEWGKDNDAFLFEAEAEIIAKALNDAMAALHPFVLLPMAGQLALLITIFQHKPSKRLTFAGILCIGVLLVFILFIGLISANYKVALSALPFMATATYIIIRYKRKSN